MTAKSIFMAILEQIINVPMEASIWGSQSLTDTQDNDKHTSSSRLNSWPSEDLREANKSIKHRQSNTKKPKGTGIIVGGERQHKDTKEQLLRTYRLLLPARRELFKEQLKSQVKQGKECAYSITTRHWWHESSPNLSTGEYHLRTDWVGST